MRGGRVLPLAAVLAASAALAAPPPRSGADAASRRKARRIDALVQAYHDAALFNGSVLVAEKGVVLLKKGYGLANMEWAIPNGPDTKFRIGSITKQFTAALVLRQVERGRIRLDGALSEYLPDYRRDTGEKVTIHHLLTHTSGIPSYTDSPRFFAEVSRDPYRVDEFVKKFCSGDLAFEPGSRFRYNNSGYFLLGAVLEQVTGQSYERLLREEILEPLGMSDTGYDRSETILPRRAAGYQKELGGYRNAPYLDMGLPYAAGALYSTVEDLFKWDQALYGTAVLSEASKERMFTPFLEGYGYGWALRTIPAGEPRTGGRQIGHTGGINGFNTDIVRLLDERILIVLLNNAGDTVLESISRGIREVLAGLEPERPKRRVADAIAAAALGKGGAAAVERYRWLKATRPRDFDFSESQINVLGYQLLARG
ncbi:MAG TPA: serine hydrolase domain-containing protein, partial [Vicinamibacteria bacterium]|nr:serine hydrolase domain-containing protein [Vicinamibacteria bacterium]